jgi:hypothetical protein
LHVREQPALAVFDEVVVFRAGDGHDETIQQVPRGEGLGTQMRVARKVPGTGGGEPENWTGEIYIERVCVCVSRG